jgi:hypothetical protein
MENKKKVVVFYNMHLFYCLLFVKCGEKENNVKKNKKNNKKHKPLCLYFDCSTCFYILIYLFSMKFR